MQITFIGDAHGNFRVLAEIIKRHRFHNDVVHVGDLGIGFGEKQQEFPENFFFIHGNHDNPDMCAERYPANFIGRYKYYSRTKTFFVSGAWSIDKQCRVEGRDWWSNEELSAKESQEAFELYTRTKPKFVITHDGPTKAINTLINPYWGGVIPTATGQLLDAMFEIHKPELWIFGHHHVNFDQVIEGTRFICLAELEEITLDLKLT